MRIIGGQASGRTIASPKGTKVRPTPEMIREALFNILGSLEGVAFLDLFAGTGSVGLEALSRGAEKAVFVEKNSPMALQITRMLRDLDYASRADVLTADIRTGLARLAKARERFDIVFADPPYEKGLVHKTVQYCLESELLAEQGLLVLQHSVREPLVAPSPGGELSLMQQRRYGDSVVSFLCYLSKEC